MASLVAICWTCERFRGLKPGKGFVCEAYPDQIPVDIIASVVDHRRPFKGDHGLQYVPVEGAPKLEQESVQYSPGKGNTRCKNCRHVELPECELVKGPIDPDYWCVEFAVAKEGEDRMAITTDPPVSE